MEQSGKGTSIIVEKYGKNVFNFGTSFIECIMPFNIIDKNNYYRMIGKDLKLNDTVNLIYELIKANPTITINLLMKKSNKSRPTITRAISQLKKSCLLERIGSDKSGYWKILK